MSVKKLREQKRKHILSILRRPLSEFQGELMRKKRRKRRRDRETFRTRDSEHPERETVK